MWILYNSYTYNLDIFYFFALLILTHPAFNFIAQFYSLYTLKHYFFQYFFFFSFLFVSSFRFFEQIFVLPRASTQSEAWKKIILRANVKRKYNSFEIYIKKNCCNPFQMKWKTYRYTIDSEYWFSFFLLYLIQRIRILVFAIKRWKEYFLLLSELGTSPRTR